MVSTLPRKNTFNSSELSRNTSKVFDAAAQHPVSVNRRNAENFVLMTEERATAQSELLHLAAQLIAISTSTEGTMASRMSVSFPWMCALSDEDQEACASAVLRAARASFSTDQPHLAITELEAWRGTAEALAAGVTVDTIEWLDDVEPLERP